VPDAALGSGTSGGAPATTQPDGIVDITSLYPRPKARATLVDPLNIDYSELEPESDEDCTIRSRSAKDKSPTPQYPVVDSILPSASDLTGSSKVVSAVHQRVFSHAGDSGSSSYDTDIEAPCGGIFVSNESPSVVARRLSMSSNARIFRDLMRKVLQFCNDDRECSLLQEASDSFGFPIMEEELSKDSAKEILYQVQNLSMKSFLACRAAQNC
jgi:hypothetical protein